MVNSNGVTSDETLGWLAVPDVMERTGATLPTVRGWLHDRLIIGVRRGENHAVMVPEQFVTAEGPLSSLRGTITVLSDSGMDDAEIIDWLHREDDTLYGGSPIAALVHGRKAEVRRRAQEAAF